MRRMKIGKTGIEVSVVSLGTSPLGGGTAWEGGCDEAEAIRTIHAAGDCGINFIDCGHSYGFGRSEERIGKAIKGRREQFVVADKGGLVWDGRPGSFHMERDGLTIRRNLTAASLKKDLEDSLRLLQTDYIDVYFTHWQAAASDPEFATPVAETMGALMDLKREGKIRAVGLSNATPEQVREYLRHGAVDVVQERYSMVYRRMEGILWPLCREEGMTFMAYSPLETGLLAGKIGMDFVVRGDVRARVRWFEPRRRRMLLDVLEGWRPLCGKYDCSLANLVVAWTLARAPFVNVICGGRRPEQISDNARAGDIELSAADAATMDADLDRLFAAEGALPPDPRYKF